MLMTRGLKVAACAMSGYHLQRRCKSQHRKFSFFQGNRRAFAFSGRPGEEPALWWDDIVLKFSGDIETNPCPKAKREETYTCLCCDRKITKSQGSKSATAWKICTGCISPVSK